MQEQPNLNPEGIDKQISALLESIQLDNREDGIAACLFDVRDNAPVHLAGVTFDHEIKDGRLYFSPAAENEHTPYWQMQQVVAEGNGRGVFRQNIQLGQDAFSLAIVTFSHTQEHHQALALLLPTEDTEYFEGDILGDTKRRLTAQESCRYYSKQFTALQSIIQATTILWKDVISTFGENIEQVTSQKNALHEIATTFLELPTYYITSPEKGTLRHNLNRRLFRLSPHSRWSVGDQFSALYPRTILHDLMHPLASVPFDAYFIASNFTNEVKRPDLPKIHHFTDDLIASIHSPLITEFLIDLYDIRHVRPYKPSSYPLSYVFTSAKLDMNNFAQTKNIDMAFDIDSIMPQKNILIDHYLLYRAVTNILANAVRHTPEGGEITTTVNLLQSGAEQLVEFIIADTGTGISMDMLPKIFISGESGARSSGLGLATVKEAILKHGGTIWVESYVREGDKVYRLSADADGKILSRSVVNTNQTGTRFHCTFPAVYTETPEESNEE